MKPTLTMDSVKSSVPTVDQPGETKQSIRSRWITGIIIATVVVTVVIAATAVLSVYLGSKICQDNFKEAWVTFSAKGMNSTTNRVVATKREQDVTNPGKFRTIYDFQERVMVTQYADDVESVCYVSDWDVDKEGSGADVMTKMTDTHLNRTVTFDPRKHIIESTGETVDISTLSPRAREMCFDSGIYRAVETIDDGMLSRRKRGYYYRCYFVCNMGNCLIKCFWYSFRK